MKFKIRQYQNKFKMRFSEGLYFFKRKYGKWWNLFREKGHEKMTVMFIPHNEKKIFTFQISKFIISFFIVLFLIVIMTSSYAIIKNTSAKREEQRLLMNYKDIRSNLLRFKKKTRSISNLINDVKPEVEKMYELSSGDSRNVSKIWELPETPDNSKQKKDEKNLKSLLPDEVALLRKIQHDLRCTTNTIRTVKRFIDVRTKVIKDIPSIIPNPGHVTSLFGWRRSPFGFGRDFHSGIDIAAPSGTEIRATAPGEVVSNGWNGGYGYTVRLKHKYGFETIYGHCSKVAVELGKFVRKGQVVAYVGQTGSATGNHCHYEIRLGNVAINPYPYMSKVW